MRSYLIILISFFLQILVAQKLDTAIVFKDYFSHHDAKHRNTFYYPKTDSFVKAPPTAIYKFAVYQEEEPKRKVYMINESEVSKSVFEKESQLFDQVMYKPYFLKAYHKNGAVLCKCKYLMDEPIDTCVYYSHDGKIYEKTYTKMDIVKYHDPDSGDPIRKLHFAKVETFNKEGALTKTVTTDYDKKTRITEIYHGAGHPPKVKEETLK